MSGSHINNSSANSCYTNFIPFQYPYYYIYPPFLQLSYPLHSLNDGVEQKREELEVKEPFCQKIPDKEIQEDKRKVKYIKNRKEFRQRLKKKYMPFIIKLLKNNMKQSEGNHEQYINLRYYDPYSAPPITLLEQDNVLHEYLSTKKSSLKHHSHYNTPKYSLNFQDRDSEQFNRQRSRKIVKLVQNSKKMSTRSDQMNEKKVKVQSQIRNSLIKLQEIKPISSQFEKLQSKPVASFQKVKSQDQIIKSIKSLITERQNKRKETLQNKVESEYLHHTLNPKDQSQ